MDSKTVIKVLGVTAGLGLIIFGAGIDLTGIGLPEGIGADALGVVIILASLGWL